MRRNTKPHVAGEKYRACYEVQNAVQSLYRVGIIYEDKQQRWTSVSYRWSTSRQT
jgi:hypothetical protein